MDTHSLAHLPPDYHLPQAYHSDGGYGYDSGGLLSGRQCVELHHLHLKGQPRALGIDVGRDHYGGHRHHTGQLCHLGQPLRALPQSPRGRCTTDTHHTHLGHLRHGVHPARRALGIGYSHHTLRPEGSQGAQQALAVPLHCGVPRYGADLVLEQLRHLRQVPQVDCAYRSHPQRTDSLHGLLAR